MGSVRGNHSNGARLYFALFVADGDKSAAFQHEDDLHI